MAGKRKGMSKGSGTRSGLLWEVERILNECGEELPQVLLMENVKAILSEQTIGDFREWIRFLQSKGYSNYYQVLNAKDYGIPQNRERCFMVSILGDAFYEFPEPKPLNLKLKDMLEDEVDEKFYLSAKMVKGMQSTKFRQYSYEKALHDTNGIADTIVALFDHAPQCIEVDKKPSFDEVYKKISESSYTQNQKKIQEDEVCSTLCARDYKDLKCVIVEDRCLQVGQMYGTDAEPNPQAGRVYDSNGLSPTLDTCSGGNRMPKIAIKNATKQGYLEAEVGDGVDISSRMETHRGTVQKGMIHTIKATCDVGVVVPNMKTQLCNELIEKAIVKEGDVIRHSYTMARMNGKMNDIKEKNISPTLDTRCDCLGITTKERSNSLRIRKLTPKECWRLMGFDDEDFDKAEKVNSNSQLYKQAGNSIVVNVLEAIFKQML